MNDKLAKLIATYERHQAALARAQKRLDDIAERLSLAMRKGRLLHASDYRIVVRPDGHSFTSQAHMLDQVFGDTWCDDDGSISQSAQRYVDAWNSSGVFNHHADLQRMNLVTGEYEDIDGCGGFYSIDGVAPLNEIRDQLDPGIKGVDVADIEIVEFA